MSFVGLQNHRENKRTTRNEAMNEAGACSSVATTAAVEEEHCRDHCADLEDYDWDDDRWDVDIDNCRQEDENGDPAYVKAHFDSIYVDRVVESIDRGKNVFVTGSPGTGKSTCIERVTAKLYDRGCSLLVTGSTGTAACKVSGMALEHLNRAVRESKLPEEALTYLSPSTMHSAWGMGYCEVNKWDELQPAATEFVDWYRVEIFFKAVRTGRRPPKIARAKVLVIDEVSMVDPLLMSAFDRVARLWRREPNKPFGGLIVVFVGDFQQLPPVYRKPRSGREHPIYLFQHGKLTQGTDDGGWVDKVVHLKANIRQENDPAYAQMLARMAKNAMAQKDRDLLKRCVLKPARDNGVDAAFDPLVLPGVMRVFNRNAQIDLYKKRLMEHVREEDKITLALCEEFAPSKEEAAEAYGRAAVETKVEKFKKACLEGIDTEFFVGCSVMIKANIDFVNGLVNGAVGSFLGLDRDGAPLVQLQSTDQVHSIPRSSFTTHLDEYTELQRRKIPGGHSFPVPGKPVAKYVLRIHQLKLAVALTPHSLQGLTLTRLLYHPDSETGCRALTRETFLVTLSRLRGSGLADKNKTEHLEAGRADSIKPDTTKPRPKGLFLTRAVYYSKYVNEDVTEYVENIHSCHFPLC